MNQITIGIFRQERGIWTGRIQALGIDAPICLVEVDTRENEGASPDMRVHLGDSAEGFPIGEARHLPGGPGGFHIAVRIDGPFCPRPIDAMLLNAGCGDVHYLVWVRPPDPTRRADPMRGFIHHAAIAALAIMLPDAVAHAQRVPSAREPGRSVEVFVTEAAEVRAAGSVDIRGDARRKRRKSARSLNGRGHGADADHARDMDGDTGHHSRDRWLT